MAILLYLVPSLNRAEESLASLIISSAQSSAARYFVTGSSSLNVRYSGAEKIPVRYVLAPALAAEQVRERVASFDPLSVFAAQVRKCVLRPFSAQVAFLRSHYLASRAEALFAGFFRCLGRHLNLGAVSDVRGNLKTYLNAS
jgi:hypothetical protein